MPGWAMGNLIIGLIMGVSLKKVKKIRSKAMQVALMAVAAVIAAFLGIEIVKSFFDSIIVSQPFSVRFVKNMTSFIADAFVIVISLPICVMVEKYAKKLRYGEN